MQFYRTKIPYRRPLHTQHNATKSSKREPLSIIVFDFVSILYLPKKWFRHYKKVIVLTIISIKGQSLAFQKNREINNLSKIKIIGIFLVDSWTKICHLISAPFANIILILLCQHEFQYLFHLSVSVPYFQKHIKIIG